MTLDGLTLRGVTTELKDKLRNAKIQKVLMPEKMEIVLQLYAAASGTMRLVISADAGDCGMYLSSHTKENPKMAPAFCMFLRKYLIGAVIAGVEQTGLDRVVTLLLDTKDELMRPRRLKLIVEVMGKYSNVVLTNADDIILDSLRRVSQDMSSLRLILPGIRYEVPPQHKWDPSSTSIVTLSEILRPLEDTRLDRFIPRVLDGISVQTADEVLARCGYPDSVFSGALGPHDYTAVATALKDFVDECARDPRPSIQFNADNIPIFFSIVPFSFTYPKEGRRTFPSANEMLDFYFGRRQEMQRLAQAKASLDKMLTKKLHKVQKLIRLYEDSIQSAAQIDKLQMRADHITANLYRLKKGMRSFESMDYETGQPLEIPLDVSEQPAQTAQRLYKRIAKFKKAAQLNGAKLEEAREEEEYLQGTLMYTETAQSLDELAEIRASLIQAGILTKPKKNGPAPVAASLPLEYVSPSGLHVYVGKNDRQNEYLTHKLARKEDIWFHAQKIPGSHVILQTNGLPLGQIDDASIEFAAGLAAAHSKAKRSGKTPVDYTERRNVKKPPRSRPGKVIYDHYYTVYVDASLPIQEKTSEPDGPPLGTT